MLQQSGVNGRGVRPDFAREQRIAESAKVYHKCKEGGLRGQSMRHGSSTTIIVNVLIQTFSAHNIPAALPCLPKFDFVSNLWVTMFDLWLNALEFIRLGFSPQYAQAPVSPNTG